MGCRLGGDEVASCENFVALSGNNNCDAELS